MSIDQMTIAYARRALRDAVRHHLFDSNITLIEFGLKERAGQIVEDEVAIRFHVRRKLSGLGLEIAIEAGQTRPIPAEIGGFQTDVPQGSYRPQWLSRWGNWRRPRPSNPRAVPATPMVGGLSISDERHHTFGTLGGLVIDRVTGEALLLSNWHVLVADWRARPGQRIYQPGRLDGGTAADTVATLTRDAMSANLDAAVARLTGHRRLINDQFELGQVQGVGQAELGMEVVKSGRRTGVTTGRVTAIEGVAKMRYGHLERVVRHVVTIEPKWNLGEISGPGDSGAIWLDRTTMRAVGLHFAGSNLPERGLALDMAAVLDALNVDLAVDLNP